MEKVIFSSFACERDPKYQIITQIIDRNGKRAVRKTALNETGIAHISDMKEYEKRLNNVFAVSDFFKVCPIENQGKDWVEFAYQTGQTLEQWFDELTRKGDTTQIKETLNLFWQNLLKMAQGSFAAGQAFSAVFGDKLPTKTTLHGAENQDIDLIFSNLFFSGKQADSFIVADYEWVFPFAIPLEYIYYRSVFCSVALSRNAEEIKSEFYQVAGIDPEDLNAFLEMEIHFQTYITGQTKTMAEHYKRMGKDVLPAAAARIPYEVVIRNGMAVLAKKDTRASSLKMDLSGFETDGLKIQTGYPFSIIQMLSPQKDGWICTNADYSKANIYMAGSEPLVFEWKGGNHPSFEYQIKDTDEYAYQETVKGRILEYGDKIGGLETQIRALGDQIQSQSDQIQNQSEQIQNQAEQIQNQVEQINAYETEWKQLADAGKVCHAKPVALIRQKQEERRQQQMKDATGPDATIVIPTKNGGDLFKQVLDRVFGQVTQYTYEVICVDSGSTDNTLQIIQESSAKLFQIKPEEFGHGKTRNFGASQGTGEFICFLTQDALPVHESWLENMLNAMKLDPQIAGGFGRHLPYSQCNFIDERDINGLFAGFGQTNTVYWNEDPERYDKDPGYRSVLAFFSDNNSCLRRSVWEQYPYPEVEFAEDQIWMRQMIEKGYKKVYCPEATVYHSHNYSPSTYFMRYYDEHKGLYEIHGYTNLKHWWYVPAATCKHVLSDMKYIRSTQNTKRKKLGMIRYSIRRNYARYAGGYIGGHYHEKSPQKQQMLDRKYSQQYRQRRGESMGRVHNLAAHFKQTYKDEGFAKSLKFLKNKVKHTYKTQGIQGVVGKINTISGQINIPEFYGFVSNDTPIPMNTEQRNAALASETILLNWIIPEMGIGSGGHMNIFRFISLLEDRGIHNRIYVCDATKMLTDKDLREFLTAHYNITNEHVEAFCSTDSITFAHGTVATGWQTAYFVRRFQNTISKFYFVQDFEPLFFPMGSEYLMAENTYKFGFRGITAGEWLKNKLHNEYHMETNSFLFSYDRSIYQPGTKRDQKKRLFLYVRPVTPRRCFEIALLALCKLHEKMPEIEVVMAGWDVSNYYIPFIHLNAGNLSLQELPDLYAQCDICVVMSSTNLSLLPVEVMASNSVVACTAGTNNEWLINKDNAIIIPNDPIGIADTLYDVLQDPDRLQKLRENGLKFAQEYTSWENEADKVYQYILEGIKEDETTI